MLTIDEVLEDFARYVGCNVEEVSVNARSPDGVTPLHWMAVLGDGKAIRLLAASGADLSATDASGNTALHGAIINRQVSAAEVLIALGAPVGVRNSSGLTAQELAIRDAYKPAIALFSGSVGHA